MSFDTFSSSLRQEVRIGQEAHSFGQARGWEVVRSIRSMAKGLLTSLQSSGRSTSCSEAVHTWSAALGPLMVAALDSLCRAEDLTQVSCL